MALNAAGGYCKSLEVRFTPLNEDGSLKPVASKLLSVKDFTLTVNDVRIAADTIKRLSGVAEHAYTTFKTYESVLQKYDVPVVDLRPETIESLGLGPAAYNRALVARQP